MSKVDYNSNWDSVKRGGFLDLGLLEMATDIHKRSVILAPRDSGDLVLSGKIEPVPGGYKVKYGNEKVPYARRRHFENKKNPQTIGYLSKAGDSVIRGNTEKYFKNKI